MKEDKKRVPTPMDCLEIEHPHNLTLKLIDQKINKLIEAHQHVLSIRNYNKLKPGSEADMKIITDQLKSLETTKSLLIEFGR